MQQNNEDELPSHKPGRKKETSFGSDFCTIQENVVENEEPWAVIGDECPPVSSTEGSLSSGIPQRRRKQTSNVSVPSAYFSPDVYSIYREENLPDDETSATEDERRRILQLRELCRSSNALHSLQLTSSPDEMNASHYSSESHHHAGRRRQRQISQAFSVFQATGLDADAALINVPDRFHHHKGMRGRLRWFGMLCLAGIGMFVEAFLIITTGQIKTIWHAQYPECWVPDEDQFCPQNIQCCCLFPNTPSFNDTIVLSDTCAADGSYPDLVLCSERITNSISYAEFAGIMLGMIVFGSVCDIIGRKRTGVLTGLFTMLGLSVMVFVRADDIQTQFAVWSGFFACMGFGIGGEYPLTASSAAEYHEERVDEARLDDEEKRYRRLEQDRLQTVYRGQTIAMAFSMQGLGALVGSIVLLILIYFGEQGFIDCDEPSSNSTGNDPRALNGIWRSFYFVGLLFVLFLISYRSLVVEESQSFAQVMERKRRRKLREKTREKKTRWDIIRFYWPRLVGTGGNWFLWDVGFYGLKLFSGPIFRAINPEGDLLVTNGWLLFNNLCALAGYFCAIAVIDMKSVGRVRLQMFSFLSTAIIFFTTAIIFDSAPSSVIMFLFFLSSFTGNFGANVTTYVTAAESYPTEIRSTNHGISAFLGKAVSKADPLTHYVNHGMFISSCPLVRSARFISSRGHCLPPSLLITWIQTRFSTQPAQHVSLDSCSHLCFPVI